MQETRCSTENMLEFKIPDWQIFSVSSKLDGARSANRYSGTCIWVKQSFGIPTSVIPYLSTLPTEHYLNNEGRYLELHFKNLIIINTYVPNLGGSMSVESNRSGNTDTEYLFEHNDRLLKWDTALKEHLLNLKKSKKEVILAGDLNVAHTPQDVFFCDPKLHFKKEYTAKQLERFYQSDKVQGLGKQRMPGFTFHERENFTSLLSSTNMIDIWREQHPDTNQYSWFNLRQKTQRAKKLGWRLDYFVVSPSIAEKTIESRIMDNIGEESVKAVGKYASDHVPVYMSFD